MSDDFAIAPSAFASNEGSSPPDDELLAAAEAAAILTPLEPFRASQLARLVVRVLTDGQIKLLGDAIVTDRVGREPGHEIPDGVEDGHAAA